MSIQTHLIPVREVRTGDRLHYLVPTVLVVEQVTTESINGRSYICLHHAEGVRRINVFGHVHREAIASSSIR